MDNLRRKQLTANWEGECDDENMDWRKELTPEEMDFVASLDNAYHRGTMAMVSVILIQKKIATTILK